MSRAKLSGHTTCRAPPGHRRRRLLCSAAVAALAATPAARAADKTWIGGSGFWDDSVHWSPLNQPGPGDNALLLNSGTSNIAAVLDLFTPPTSTNLGYVRIDATGTGTFTLTQSDSLLSEATLYVGSNAAGIFTLAGGTHTATAAYFAKSIGSSGKGTMTGGTFNVGSELIGFGGNATFVQNGGRNLPNYLEIAGSGTGSYSLAGTGVLIAPTEYVAVNGTGYFTQTDGTNTAGQFAIGLNNAGSGTVTLSGGNLTVTNEIIGNFGHGWFVQDAGTHVVGTNGLTLGAQASGGGTFVLSAGTLNVSGDMYVGKFGGHGIYEQGGGLLKVSNASTLYFGYSNSGAVQSAGFGSLFGGTIQTPFEIVGNYGQGTFDQSAGNHAPNVLTIGAAAGGSGTFTLSGGSVTTFNTTIGSSGTGDFIQTGGTHTANILAAGYMNAGSYSLTNGTLVSATAYVGRIAGGVGTFNQTGGLADLSEFLIGFETGTSGTANIGGGTLTSADLVVGSHGNYVQTGGAVTAGTGGASTGLEIDGGGQFSISGGNITINHLASVGTVYPGAATYMQTGGSVHVSSLGPLPAGLIFGNEAFGEGVGTMTDGTLDVAYEEYVGYFGSGTFTQAGGSNQALYFTTGFQPGSTGTATLAGGTLTTSGGSFVGWYGNGIFNQSGGTHAAAALYVGSQSNGTNPASTGVYTQTGGNATVSGTAYIGWFGIGTYNQSGGTFSATSLTLGSAPNANGSFNMSNGAAVNIASAETIGDGGTGTFTQTGGSHTIAGDLVIGNAVGALGTYTLSGGGTNPAGTLVVVGNETIGNLANGGGWSAGGTFIQGRGDHTVGLSTNAARTLTIAAGNGSTGSYNLSGGSLTVNGSNRIGFEGSATFTQSGGTHQVNGFYFDGAGLFLGFGTAGTGSYTLSNGLLSVPDTAETVGYGGRGTLSQSGGTNTMAFLIIGDHAISPTIVGSGTVILSQGLLQTSETYAGLYGDGTFNQSGGTHLAGNLVLAFGTTVAHTSVGTYNLNGGLLAVSGSEHVAEAGVGLFNQTGGTHTIGADLAVTEFPGGSGTVNLSGGSLTAGSTVNNGTINQTGGLSNLGPVTGSNGLLLIGNTGGASALMNVTSFQQNMVIVRSTGTMVVSHNSPRVTNTANTLLILGSGLLDLGNNALLVNNSATPEAIVRTYLRNGYNAGGGGIGDWLGEGGITSADAISSHNGPSPDFHVSVGYVNGAYANDPLIGGPIPGQPGLATNQILIRPALYGDFNLDGKVDDTDLAIFSGLGQYNQPTNKFGWLGGDLNHDGKVDDTDLLIFSGAGNYNGPAYGASSAASAGMAASATPSLTGHADADARGSAGDGRMDFEYDAATGRLTIRYDGDTAITPANPLQIIRLFSASGRFLPAHFHGDAFGATTSTADTLNGSILTTAAVPDGYDLGQVLPAGLTASDLSSDLTLAWNVYGGGTALRPGDFTIVNAIPEPSTLGSLGLAAVVVLARRRRYF